MATAERVKQDDKVMFTRVPTTTQTYRVVVTDNVEVRREHIGEPMTSYFVRPDRTPQPDRIVLEMSVEEAQEVYAALAPRFGEAAYETYCALHELLSPTTGTQTSPTKDATGGGALGGYNPKGLNTR